MIGDELSRLRAMQASLCSSNECKIRERCTSAHPELCRSLPAMGFNDEKWDELLARSAELEREVERLRELVDQIDRTLRVPAAEYVPAIGDVFTLIDHAKRERSGG